MSDKVQKDVIRPSGFIQSVDRAISILEFFTAERHEAGVSDIARTLHLNKSTTFGLLSTLERRGYVEQNPDNGRYRLGLKSIEIGTTKLAGFPLTRAAHPVLCDLVARLGETAHLAVYDRGEVVYVDKVEADNALQISSFIGKRNPSYCTGVGKCLLAFQPEEEIERVIRAGLPPRTPKTLVDPEIFKQELSRVRRNNRSRDEEEFVMGLICSASPIRDNRGQVCAAISVSAPTIRASSGTMSHIDDMVSEAATRISEALGYRPAS
jgi:DNA-binding IclR family transcriptional regulator